MTAEPTKPKQPAARSTPKPAKTLSEKSPTKARRTRSPAAAIGASRPAKPAHTPTIPSPVATQEADTDKSKKPKKPKLVRDSFKFPQQEYAAFDALKARCLKAGLAIKKSELVRAGLVALQSLDDDQLIEILNKLEKLKAGRPAN
jgi:hypothetical protein